MSEDSSLTRLLLIRHGQVEPAWQDRIYGCLDVPLSSRGREEARSATLLLGSETLAAVVSSGLERAEFGAELLRSSRALARVDDPDLREIDRGAWAGLSFSELERDEPGVWEAWHAEPATTRPPEGESLNDLAARVWPRLDHWAAAHPGGVVAVVTHSWVVRLAVCRALGLALETAIRLDVPTGGVVVLEWPVLGGGSDLRPTLSGFATDHPPEPGTAWFRGPHRAGATRT